MKEWRDCRRTEEENVMNGRVERIAEGRGKGRGIYGEESIRKAGQRVRGREDGST